MPSALGEGMAGYEAFANEEAVVAAGSHALVGTGMMISIPPGFQGKIGALPDKGVEVGNAVFNHQFNGELSVMLQNHKEQAWEKASCSC